MAAIRSDGLNRATLLRAMIPALVLAALSCDSSPAAAPESRLEQLASADRRASSRNPAPVFPVGMPRFDMICEGDGRVLGNPFPEQLRSSPAPTADPWHESFRESVDLERMQTCGLWCRTMPPLNIASVNAERITFADRRGVLRWVRRSDGRYRHWLQRGDRIDDLWGYCRRAPFTEFIE